MRNGKAIQDSPNYILSPRGETLLIPKATRDLAGDYSCVVKSPAGSVEAPFIVSIQMAPHIDEPIDQNPKIVEGQSIVLNCPVLGLPQPIVTWRRLDQDLQISPNGKYQLDGVSNLKISDVTVSFKITIQKNF